MRRTLYILLRNPLSLLGLALVSLVVLSAVLADLITPFPAHVGAVVDFANNNRPPHWPYIMGTDLVGRDLFTRIVYAYRISLILGVVVLAIAVPVGVTIGLVAGYLGGWVEYVLMRITDVFLGFPAVVLTLAIVAVLGPGVINISAAIIAVTWTEYARVVRATTLVLREQNYVQAARALGASAPRILFGEILPNTLGPIVVLASLGLGTAVSIESAMSFLGFGLPPPTPTWGWTLSYGTRFIRDEPWLSIISGATIMITVLGFNLLGDGLRDILDPRQLTRVGAKK